MFIIDLFANKKLEYVYIKNGYSDRNIVGSMTLSRNIANLRFMDIDQRKVNYGIKLDI